VEVGLFYLPSTGSKQELMEGMAGKRTDLYQKMLRNMTQQIQYCDEHGYWGSATTEHHFHIEGEEVSTNPVMLDLYFGMQTKHMRFGQLGKVLPCENPIRFAEDIAILDQMLQGRAFAGFARGYQPRWVDVLGQQITGLGDSVTDPAAYEELKKELYYEHFEIINKAWANATFSHQGKHWKIPPREDIFWPAHEVSTELGAGVTKEGMLREVGIAPGLYQRPRPPMFQPFSFSESSVRWAVQNEVVPITVICDTDLCAAQFRAAQEGAAEVGRDLKYGEGIGMTREIICADTDEEAFRIAKDAGSYVWQKFFQPFGFNAAVAKTGEDPMALPRTFEILEERGLVICGSPDTVSRKLEALFEELPAEYFWLFTYTQLVPQPALMRHFELMTEKVLPNFTDKIS